MLWRGQRESDNVIDDRGVSGKTMSLGGLLIGAIIYYLLGGNPIAYLAQNAGSVTTGTQTSAPAQAGRTDERKSFVAVVLADTEDVWSDVFRQMGKAYTKPKLVLFSGAIASACGRASSATGPFYCPGDERVYLDTSFFDQLSRDLGAQGEFARAYVIAHEIGHHVQNLLGLMDPSRSNRASVRTELQADCLAGVWAKRTETSKHVIESGDIEQALDAAAAVGDDRLEQRSQGYVVPDSFTHGSSAQRVAAFRLGYTGGELNTCAHHTF